MREEKGDNSREWRGMRGYGRRGEMEVRERK